MLGRNLLYIAYLSLFTSTNFFADSIQGKENKILVSNKNNSIKLNQDTLKVNIEKGLHWTSIEEEDLSSSDQESVISKSEWLPIKSGDAPPPENDSGLSEIEWLPIESNDNVSPQIEWLPIDKKNYPVVDRNRKDRFIRNLQLLKQQLFDFKLLKIGSAVPTSETLSQGELRFSIGQVSPIESGYAKGSGNQNYYGEIDYGFANNFLLSFFYTDADDPLTKRIVNLPSQPENRWSSYGSSFKWKFLEKPKLNIAIQGSIENWMVQSGGCEGHDCSSNTSNIFNSETSMVENNNLVGSIALPIGLTNSSVFDFVISPKLTFLPGSQSNQYGEGDFYGNNYGIGFGVAYKAIERFKAFSSYYFPLGDSTNSFDDKLHFSKTSIYTLGMNYAIDSRTSFEAFISNGFGLSPATSVLSIPSSDEILYGFNVVYTPTKLDNYYHLNEEKPVSSKFFRGLSVSNNSFINSGDSKLNIFYDINGSWSSIYEKALSQRFIFDITAGVIDNEVSTNSDFKSYFSSGNTILRGGAKAILYSNNKENLFTSSLRGSFGRVLAESKPGYFFGESINSYDFQERVSLNLNPKIGVSGSGESIGLGTGVHWKVLKKITLISETNIPIDNAENNVTFGIRYSPDKSDKHIDIYSSNAFSFIDMGQLMKRKKNVLGVNVGILF